MRIVIVSDNISMRMGGEASLGMYYFKLFRNKGITTHVVCHARVRDEIYSTLGSDEADCFHFVQDTQAHIFIFRLSRLFPPRIGDLIFGQMIHILTMRKARTLVQQLGKDWDDWICLEPSPISPRGVSLMYALGMPVVIGPLCGGLEFPPAFRYMDRKLTRATLKVSRWLSEFLNVLIPGKKQAQAIVVANSCTRKALPRNCRGTLYEVVESGVDLSLWKPQAKPNSEASAPLRFAFSGRLVDWKGVSLLVEAFRSVASQSNAVLDIIGDGELRPAVEKCIVEMGIRDRVVLHGWKSRPEAAAIIRNCDVFVMPSLRECGGTAILEAMALGLPIISTNWAGPSTYVDYSCGILVDPVSKADFVTGLADAMMKLVENPGLRQSMGLAGIERVKTSYFDWKSKADRVLEILTDTLEEYHACMPPRRLVSARTDTSGIPSP
jgi:glycosyltransferase involved in cell wall biosynthesis